MGDTDDSGGVPGDLGPRCLQCWRAADAFSPACGHMALCMTCLRASLKSRDRGVPCPAIGCATRLTLASVVEARPAAVRQLLQQGDTNPNDLDANGRSALLWCLQGADVHPRVVQELLVAGASTRLWQGVEVEESDLRDGYEDGFTPLHVAAARGHVLPGAMLIAWGNEEEVCAAEDAKGRTYAGVCRNRSTRVRRTRARACVAGAL